ncbi:MAG: hypothetical protein O6950_01400 [Gammaproteobacteria bacterium]|nr:hypothetical protein [Gammaproteobacteria bacterium]
MSKAIKRRWLLASTGIINASRIATRKRHGDRLTKEPTARSVFDSAPGARRLARAAWLCHAWFAWAVGRDVPGPASARFRFGFLKGLW